MASTNHRTAMGRRWTVVRIPPAAVLNCWHRATRATRQQPSYWALHGPAASPHELGRREFSLDPPSFHLMTERFGAIGLASADPAGWIPAGSQALPVQAMTVQRAMGQSGAEAHLRGSPSTTVLTYDIDRSFRMVEGWRRLVDQSRHWALQQLAACSGRARGFVAQYG